MTGHIMIILGLDSIQVVTRHQGRLTQILGRVLVDIYISTNHVIGIWVSGIENKLTDPVLLNNAQSIWNKPSKC